VLTVHRGITDKLWTLSGFKKLFRKIDVDGTIDRKCGSGRRLTVRTNENVCRVQQLDY